MLKVLVVDDHTAVRAGLMEIIESAFDDVVLGQAGDGDTALQVARQTSWDVVVLDINLPGLSGLETLALLRHDRPQLPVIIVSFHAGAHYVTRSFKLGAQAYVSKTTVAEDLVLALEAVLAGGLFLSRQLAAELRLNLQERTTGPDA
jgi:DNA-binding NarL/FixJ family response regulator